MAKKNRSLEKSPVKSRVKFYTKPHRIQFDTKTVRTWVLPLLLRIDAGDYPTKAGRIIGLSRQHVWYYIRKLQECNLILQAKRSNVTFYELSNEGKKLLTSCEGSVFLSWLYRFDKCQVVYEILFEGCYPEGNFKKVTLNNWTGLFFVCFFDCTYGLVYGICLVAVVARVVKCVCEHSFAIVF